MAEALPTVSEVAEAINARKATAQPPQAAVQGIPMEAAPAEESAPAESKGMPTETEMVEAAEVVTPAPVPEKKDLNSSKFADLARKEKKARQMMAEADRRIAEAESRAKEVEARLGRYANLKKDPLGVLREEGVSYSDIMQMGLGIKEPEAVDPVDEKFNSIRDEIDKLSKGELSEVKRELAALRERETNQALREVQMSIRETVKGGNYDLIPSVGEDAYQLVQDVMTEYYTSTKKILTYEEACDKVEAWYENYFDSVASKSKKLQSKLAPKTPVAPSKPSPSSEAKGPTTLTNALNARSKATDVDKLSKTQALDYLANKYLNSKI